MCDYALRERVRMTGEIELDAELVGQGRSRSHPRIRSSREVSMIC